MPYGPLVLRLREAVRPERGHDGGLVLAPVGEIDVLVRPGPLTEERVDPPAPRDPHGRVGPAQQSEHGENLLGGHHPGRVSARSRRGEGISHGGPTPGSAVLARLPRDAQLSALRKILTREKSSRRSCAARRARAARLVREGGVRPRGEGGAVAGGAAGASVARGAGVGRVAHCLPAPTGSTTRRPGLSAPASMLKPTERRCVWVSLGGVTSTALMKTPELPLRLGG